MRRSTNLFLLTSTLMLSLFSITTHASTAAWIFAHRANSPESVRHAANDANVNAIEIDVTLRADIRRKKLNNGDCGEQNVWCTFHKNDRGAYGLADILERIRNSSNLDAVWLDIKSVDADGSDSLELINVVTNTLGTGDNTVRKFWGVWGKDYLSKPYTSAVVRRIEQPGGQDENLLIVEVDQQGHVDDIQRQCRIWDIQCGISAGNPFLGGTGGYSFPAWDMNNLDYIDDQIADRNNINSTFLWTFNWRSRGVYEDDMVRLLFSDRVYWEYLANTHWHCGQEGNGVIIGAQSSIYYQDMCPDNDDGSGSACDESNQAIINGPNEIGTRFSNIGAERNSYSNSGHCD